MLFRPMSTIGTTRSITEKRLKLQACINETRVLDAKAKLRNQALVDAAQRALALVQAAKDEAEAAAQGQHAQTQLEAVQAELAEVQARRESAKARFDAELAANEDTARAKQQLAAELELERYDEVEREAVRVGVGAEVAAAASAVEAGMTEAVRRAAAQTRDAVAVQVTSQTRWLAEELPALLEAQASHALRRLRFGNEPNNTEASDAEAVAAGRQTCGVAESDSGAAARVSEASMSDDDASAPVGEAARMTPAVGSSPARSACGSQQSASRSVQRLASCATPGVDGLRESIGSELSGGVGGEAEPARPKPETAQLAMVHVAQAALKAVQAVAARQGGDQSSLIEAQESLLAATATALDFVGKAMPSTAATVATSVPQTATQSCAQHAPPAAWHPGAMPPPVPPPWWAWYAGYAPGAQSGQLPPPGIWAGYNGTDGVACSYTAPDQAAAMNAPGSASRARCGAPLLSPHVESFDMRSAACNDDAADAAADLHAVAGAQAAALKRGGLFSPAGSQSSAHGRRVSCIDGANLPACGVGPQSHAVAEAHASGSHGCGAAHRAPVNLSLSASLGRSYGEEEWSAGASLDRHSLGASSMSSSLPEPSDAALASSMPNTTASNTTAASRPNLSVGSKAVRSYCHNLLVTAVCILAILTPSLACVFAEQG